MKRSHSGSSGSTNGSWSSGNNARLHISKKSRGYSTGRCMGSRYRRSSRHCLLLKRRSIRGFDGRFGGRLIHKVIPSSRRRSSPSSHSYRTPCYSSACRHRQNSGGNSRYGHYGGHLSYCLTRCNQSRLCCRPATLGFSYKRYRGVLWRDYGGGVGRCGHPRTFYHMFEMFFPSIHRLL